MQLVTPRVVPMAVSTAMSICKIVFQTSFFIFFFLMVQQSVFSSGSSVSFLKLLIGIGVHSPVASQFFSG